MMVVCVFHLLLKWKGHTPDGVVDSKSIVSAVDLLPTFCSLAGIELPDGYQSDGQDVVRSFWEIGAKGSTALLGLDRDAVGIPQQESRFGPALWQVEVSDEPGRLAQRVIRL